MKVILRATVVYEWEEDSENWADENPKTEDELAKLAIAYAEEDHQYFLEGAPASLTVERIE